MTAAVATISQCKLPQIMKLDTKANSGGTYSVFYWWLISLSPPTSSLPVHHFLRQFVCLPACQSVSSFIFLSCKVYDEINLIIGSVELMRLTISLKEKRKILFSTSLNSKLSLNKERQKENIIILWFPDLYLSSICLSASVSLSLEIKGEIVIKKEIDLK